MDSLSELARQFHENSLKGNIPVIPQSNQEDFMSVLVNLASGCSPEPAKDAQMLLRMMSEEFKDKVLENYPSIELREILSVPYESKVKYFSDQAS